MKIKYDVLMRFLLYHVFNETKKNISLNHDDLKKDRNVEEHVDILSGELRGSTII